MSEVHVHRRSVRFGECDPAGIVYYPRFFGWFHEAMETWFGDALGHPYEELILGRKVGFPAAHTSCDYKSPCAFGQRVGVEVRVARVGTTSVDLRFTVRGSGDGVIRAEGRTVVVHVDMDSESPTWMQPRPLDGVLRAAIEAYAARTADD